MAATARGFGLVGMEERVTLPGGKLEIESAPGRGTEVRAELPITQPAADRRHQGRHACQRLLARPADLLIFEEPVLAGEGDRLGAAGRVELPVDRRAMRLDRADADHQLLRDLGIGVAGRDQAQNFHLARSQAARRPLGLRTPGARPGSG